MPRNLLAYSHSLIYQPVPGYDLRDQSAQQCLLRRHRLASEACKHCRGFPRRSRQTLSAASTRHDAQLDLGLPEYCVACRDHDVAHHGEFAPSSQCISTHGGNDRLTQAADAIPATADIVLTERRLIVELR